MAKKDIVCDECGATLELEGLIRDRIIGRDKSGDVKERYFECPFCGRHYTITVYNRRMALKITKRRQLQGKIKRSWGKMQSTQQFRSWMAEDARLRNELIDEARVLKKKYLQEE